MHALSLLRLMLLPLVVMLAFLSPCIFFRHCQACFSLATMLTLFSLQVLLDGLLEGEKRHGANLNS